MISDERKIREELVKQLEALKYKVDGSPMESIMAHLWVNKCIEVVRPKD